MAEKYKVGDYVTLNGKPGTIAHVHNHEETWICIRSKETRATIKTRATNKEVKKITKEEYEGLRN